MWTHAYPDFLLAGYEFGLMRWDCPEMVYCIHISAEFDLNINLSSEFTDVQLLTLQRAKYISTLTHISFRTPLASRLFLENSGHFMIRSIVIHACKEVAFLPGASNEFHSFSFSARKGPTKHILRIDGPYT